MNEKSLLITTHGLDTIIPEGSSLRASASPKTKYPAPFFDPITNRVMKDPVVAPGTGISYERSSWEALCRDHTEPSAPAYENRALRQIIEETIVHKNNIIQQKMNFRRSSQMLSKKVHQTLRKNLTELMEKSMLPTDDHKSFSEAYYCPITFSLMKFPVIGPEGYSFEKYAIEQWIDRNEVSPVTRSPLPSKRLLYPNLNLKEMLLLEIANLKEEELSQSIREYKASLLDSQPIPDNEEGQSSSSFDGPKTLEEWQSLRQKRRQTNVQLTCDGLLQCIYLFVFLVVGVVAGVLLGALALILGTILDLFVAPLIQCFLPGGCQGGDDDLYDDEFIAYGSFHEDADSETVEE